MKTKKQIRELVKKYFPNYAKDADQTKRITNLFYDLQELYIEVSERQELKAGRGVYGNFPYTLRVDVYDLRKNIFNYLGDGVIKGDYAGHKGIQNVALDCIGEYYGIDKRSYLHSYEMLHELNIKVRHLRLEYNGRNTKRAFNWCNEYNG